MAVSLQNCLDSASYLLGESSTPTSQTTIRARFANEAKEYLRNLRNWSWEKKDATPIDLVSGTNNYPLATDFKNNKAMEWVSVTDTAGNVTYLTPVSENDWNTITNAQQTDAVYWVKGNAVDGYTIYINPTPASDVTSGLNYRYYMLEPDLVATTDTTRVPKVEVISWYIAAKVLYGYREQSQYQLAMQSFNGAVEDTANEDMKKAPYENAQIQNFRQYSGASTNFKNYY